MRLKVLWVGKTQEEWLRRGIEEYAGRVKRYTHLDLAEVREEKGAPPALMREKETERLVRMLPRGARLVLLDELGEEMDSPRFATFIRDNRDAGVGELVFVIGGAYGVTDDLRKRAERKIAVSRMTLTHQMVRLFLLEQIYRGFTIIGGEGYHH